MHNVGDRLSLDPKKISLICPCGSSSPENSGFANVLHIKSFLYRPSYCYFCGLCKLTIQLALVPRLSKRPQSSHDSSLPVSPLLQWLLTSLLRQRMRTLGTLEMIYLTTAFKSFQFSLIGPYGGQIYLLHSCQTTTPFCSPVSVFEKLCRVSLIK